MAKKLAEEVCWSCGEPAVTYYWGYAAFPTCDRDRCNEEIQDALGKRDWDAEKAPPA
jgi:hypothetical protein